MSEERDSYYRRVEHYSAARVAPFNAANRRFPDARETERSYLLDRLTFRDHMSILNPGAGGGYLTEGLANRATNTSRIICTDTAEHFVASASKRFGRVVCGMDALALADGSVDVVTNLAGLHHVEHKPAFFREACRVLKPGGQIAVADVREGTPVAKWLNGPVDRMTDIGHDGRFVATGEFTAMLGDAGFVGIDERYETYFWDLPDKPALVRYAKDLFRLSRATLGEVERALDETLAPQSGSHGIRLHWGLIFVSARKAGRAAPTPDTEATRSPDARDTRGVGPERV